MRIYMYLLAARGASVGVGAGDWLAVTRKGLPNAVGLRAPPCAAGRLPLGSLSRLGACCMLGRGWGPPLPLALKLLLLAAEMGLEPSSEVVPPLPPAMPPLAAVPQLPQSSSSPTRPKGDAPPNSSSDVLWSAAALNTGGAAGLVW